MRLVKDIAPHNSLTCYVKDMKELGSYFTGPAC